MKIITNRVNEQHEKIDSTADLSSGKWCGMFESGGRKRDENGNFYHYRNCHICRSSYRIEEEDFLSGEFQQQVINLTFACPCCGYVENWFSIQGDLHHEFRCFEISPSLMTTITPGEFLIGQLIRNEWARKGRKCNGIPYVESPIVNL